MLRSMNTNVFSCLRVPLNAQYAHVDHRPDPSVSGGRDGAGPRDDVELAGDDDVLSAVSHQGSGGLLSGVKPPTATANKSPRARDREDAKESTGETYEDNKVCQNDGVDRGYSSDHAGEGAEKDGRAVPPDSLATRTVSPGQREEKFPLSPQRPTSTRTISPRAGGDQDAWAEVRDEGFTSLEQDDGKAEVRFGPSGSD